LCNIKGKQQLPYQLPNIKYAEAGSFELTANISQTRKHRGIFIANLNIMDVTLSIEVQSSLFVFSGKTA
jgi:hypothetical protein